MADIDLVPASYRRERLIKSWLKRALAAYAFVLIGVGTAKAVLLHSVGSWNSNIEQLKVHKSQLLDRSSLMRDLEARKARLQERLATLDRLRGGIPTGALFQAIDASLNGETWFVQWEFLRAGEFVESKRAVNTGYFIVVPETASKRQEADWRSQTHMSIKARAKDHAALAQFVNRLEAQPAIQDIKILDTRANDHGMRQVVDFDLVIRVKDVL